MEVNKDEMRKRNSSRGELHRMSTDLMDATEEAIIDYLKCPCCRQYIRPPCVSCELGHFMCTPCKAAVEACPTCGATSFPNKGNAVFDRILNDMYYPCVNDKNGCPAFFKYSEINDHQRYCSYVKVACRFKPAGCKSMCTKRDKAAHEEICPYGVSCKLFLKYNGQVKSSCSWRGSKDQLYEHICLHPETAWLPPSSLKTNVTFTWMLALNMDVEKTEFIRLDDVGEMFYFHTKGITEGPQHIAIQHIGNDEIAEKFMYSVEFRHGRKLIVFRDNVIPYSTDNIFESTNCCNFHYEFLKYHFQAERVCDCYIRIYIRGQEDTKGKRILHFLGSDVTEERNGSISNRESFQDKIEYCIGAMGVTFLNDEPPS